MLCLIRFEGNKNIHLFSIGFHTINYLITCVSENGCYTHSCFAVLGGGGGGGVCDKSCYLKFDDKDLVDKMEPLDSVID